VSVSLPLWEHVIGYEEGKQEVLSKFRSGYPRFFLPLVVGELHAAVESKLGRAGERCLVFPRVIHAERCKAWIEKHQRVAVRVESYGDAALGVCLFPAASYDIARKYWRFAGEGIGARQAKQVLGKLAVLDGTVATHEIKSRLAALSGQLVEDVFLFPSGMAATFAVHRMLAALRPKQKTVQLGFPYVDVLKVQQYFGTGVHELPVLNEGAYASLGSIAKAESLAGLFSEVPTNPLLQCADFARVRSLIGDAPLVLDDTVGSVVHVDAFRVADVVITSLTKAFSGEGDVMAGSVILNRASPHHAASAAWMREHNDHALFGADAIALEKNSRDFTERAMTMSRNSVGLYEFLSTHPKIARVWHPINEGGEGYRALQREAANHGCLFSFILKQPERSPAFYDALAICKGPSLGTSFTLICPYTLLAHYEELDWAAKCGVPRELFRVSAGVEPLGDLVARFERALAVV
jgi:cystathionine gamma-synthase